MGEIGGVGEGQQGVADVSDTSDVSDISSDVPEQADPFDPRADTTQQPAKSNGDQRGQQTTQTEQRGQPDASPGSEDAESTPATTEVSQQNDSQSHIHGTQGDYGDPFDPRNDQPQAQLNTNGHEAHNEQQAVPSEQARRDDPFHPLDDKQVVERPDQKEIKDSSENIDYGKLDAYDRPTGIKATLTREMIGTGSEANSNIYPPNFQGREMGHARGHLLARQLGGSGDERRNLVTLYQNPVNTPNMSVVEGQVRKAVESGETVEYSVIPEYNGREGMPTAINIEAKGDRGFHITRRIENKK